MEEELSPEQQRREDVWKVLKDLHDGPGPVELMAAGGWCAPSNIIYGPSVTPSFNMTLLTEADVIMGRTR